MGTTEWEQQWDVARSRMHHMTMLLFVGNSQSGNRVPMQSAEEVAIATLLHRPANTVLRAFGSIQHSSIVMDTSSGIRCPPCKGQAAVMQDTLPRHCHTADMGPSEHAALISR